MAWVIAGQPSDTIPTVGQVYEIRDRRMGTFTGRIQSVSSNFARVERISGKIGWASNENRLFVGPYPDTVSIRDTLCYLIEVNESDD